VRAVTSKTRANGLNLVPLEGDSMSSSPQPQPEHSSNVRIERAGYIADIFVSSSPFGHIYHYVIQRQGSPEIVYWGQETSMQSAKECVNDYIEGLEKRHA
jgi:hypothetical protein